MTILSLDGGKNIGWALFTDIGIDIDRGVVSYLEFFGKQPPLTVFDRDTGNGNELSWTGYIVDVLVVEGIRHDPNISQGGSQRWESQVEGAARFAAAVAEHVELAVQPPNILPVTLMHESMEWPVTRTGKKKHLPDELAAWLHGRYYLRSVGVLS